MTVTIAAVIFIVIVSVFLIITEIFFIPGTTIFGIVGGIALIAGLYMSYTKLGTNYTAGAIGLAMVAFALFFVLGRRMTKSGQFTLTDSLDGRVNELEEDHAQVGDEGVTTGDLRPNGKALVNNKKIEVYSLGSFIEKGSEIIVAKIEGNKIYVKLKNQ